MHFLLIYYFSDIILHCYDRNICRFLFDFRPYVQALRPSSEAVVLRLSHFLILLTSCFKFFLSFLKINFLKSLHEISFKAPLLSSYFSSFICRFFNCLVLYRYHQANFEQPCIKPSSQKTAPSKCKRNSSRSVFC